MQAWESFLNRPTKGQFITIHMREEPYGEVSTTFVSKWYEELRRTWVLIDDKGNIHAVGFNKSIHKPLITTRWTDLHLFYGITADHSVLFRYIGDSMIQITIWKNPATEGSFPRFHSHHVDNRNHTTFQNLPKDFTEFLWKSGFKTLKLRDPLGVLTNCKLLIRTAPRKSIKIRKGWKTFCQKYGLQIGDEIVFDFGNEKVNLVNVRKIGL